MRDSSIILNLQIGLIKYAAIAPDTLGLKLVGTPGLAEGAQGLSNRF